MASPNEPYLVLPGSYAFSNFRLARLAKDLGAREVRGIWVHFINPKRTLQLEELQHLQQLLDYDEPPRQYDRLTLNLLDASTLR